LTDNFKSLQISFFNQHVFIPSEIKTDPIAMEDIKRRLSVTLPLFRENSPPIQTETVTSAPPIRERRGSIYLQNHPLTPEKVLEEDDEE
jgi:hypothetical protein